jgi:hypothetical protein
MEDTGFPVFKVVFTFLRIWKFEYFNADLVACGQAAS